MTSDHTHLIALITRLSDERGFLAQATTDQERKLRTVWISQIQQEIIAEEKFLGMEDVPELTAAELMAELSA